MVLGLNYFFISNNIQNKLIQIYKDYKTLIKNKLIKYQYYKKIYSLNIYQLKILFSEILSIEKKGLKDKRIIKKYSFLRKYSI